jgi:hypothetical protein
MMMSRVRLPATVMIAALVTIALPQCVSAQVIGGLHFGGPVRVSVALGRAWTDWRADPSKGPMILIEPGLGGHRLSAGYMVARGNLGTFTSARVSWLHLIRGSKGAYGGLELQYLPLFGIGGRLGAFVPLRPSSERPKFLWIADFSWGL